MTKAEHKASSTSTVDIRVEYVYDALGNRVQRTYDADGDGSGSAAVEKYAFDPLGNPWADLSSSGSLTTRRLFADAVDAVFARIGASGNEDWLLEDRLGSIRDIENSSGSLTDHIDYTSWGKISYESSPGNYDRFTFGGFELDPVTGLGLNGARWYSFDIGRWWSEDPIAFDGGQANLDVYVQNGPTEGTDPSGLTLLDNMLARRRWRLERSCDSIIVNVPRARRPIRFRVAYDYFNEREVDTLTTRLAQLYTALEDVLADIGTGGAFPSRPRAFDRFNALSPVVQTRLSRWFGGGRPLDNGRLLVVQRTFVSVRAAFNSTLNFENDYDLDYPAWSSPIGWFDIHLSAVHFWNKPPRRQVAILLHELTHTEAWTGDPGYVADASFARDAGNPDPEFRPNAPTYKSGALTPAQTRYNADSYAGFLEDYYLDWVR